MVLLCSQDERVYGDESQNLLGKAPQKQFMLSKLLLGKMVRELPILGFVSFTATVDDSA